MAKMSKTSKKKDPKDNEIEKNQEENFEPNFLDTFMNTIGVEESTFNWNGLNVSVKSTLSISDSLVFVRNVCGFCFDYDTNEYLPEFKEFAIRMAVLEMYGNVELPHDLNDRYIFVYSTDLFSEVLKYVNKDQFQKLCFSIDEKIEFSIKNNMEAIKKQLRDFSEAINKIDSRFNEMFKDVSKDQVEELKASIFTNNFTEEGLVKAFAKELKENKS